MALAVVVDAPVDGGRPSGQAVGQRRGADARTVITVGRSHPAATVDSVHTRRAVSQTQGRPLSPQ